MRRGAMPLAWAILLMALREPAGADIVRWTDERGEVHITESLDSVPERYRAGAEVLSKQRPAAPGARPSEPGTADITPLASGVAAVRFQPGRPIMAVARINGGPVVSLMIDTGAAITVIHPSVVKALGMDLREAPTVSLYGIGGTRRGRVVVLDRLEVGGAMVAPFRVTVLDTGFRGQGVIGQDFLRYFSVTMDNRAGTLTLWAH